MIIVADEGIPHLEVLQGVGDVRTVPGRNLCAETLIDAEVLLVRSVTQVNAALLCGSSIGFVASATAGTDHLDLSWLAAQGIEVAWAPGSNAMAVAEYVLQAFLRHASRLGVAPHTLTAGLAGYGHVGRRVAQLLGALGVNVWVYDPLVQIPPSEHLHECVSIEEILSASLISLHVPLVQDGENPTWHMLDAHRLARLRTGQLLVNASRGAVVDNQALKRRLAVAQPPDVILDVWENEPDIDPELLSQVWFGTPHVAGHSTEGKSQGSEMVFNALEQWLCASSSGGRSARKIPILPDQAAVAGCTLPMDIRTPDDLLLLMQRCYDLAAESDQLKSVCADEGLACHFDQIRRNRVARHELSALTLTGHVAPALRPVLSALGVTMAAG